MRTPSKPFALLLLVLASSSTVEVAAASPKASEGAPAPASSAPASAPTSAPGEVPSAPDVIAELKRGNAAFVQGATRHPHQDLARVREVAAGQTPVVTVLSCSDSRVPVEMLFDQGIGDVFTVRVAGNVADTDELGTIEYGVDHLGTPVLVVMGHTKCGAVTAVATGAELHGHIPELVDNISPAVAAAKQKNPTMDEKALVEPAIVENVFQSIADVITKSPLVRKKLKEGKVKVVGALYHLEDGSVEWLGEHPHEKDLIAKGDAAPPAPHGAAHAPASKADKGKAHPIDVDKHTEGAEHAAAPPPPPPNPMSFAIVAVFACAAGAISMKLSSRS